MRFFRVASGLAPAELCTALGRLDAVAIRCGAVESADELRLAWHLAQKAVAEKRNIARNPACEFMLWLAGRGDIDSAFRELSPRGGEREFFVVVFSDAGRERVLRELGAGTRVLAPGLKASGEPLALEKISLSRIKS